MVMVVVTEEVMDMVVAGVVAVTMMEMTQQSTTIILQTLMIMIPLISLILRPTLILLKVQMEVSYVLSFTCCFCYQRNLQFVQNFFSFYKLLNEILC